MGRRADLDIVKKKRYIYALVHKGKYVYIGTAVSPKSRFKQHINLAKKGEKALIYKFIRSIDFDIKLKVLAETFGTYNNAEEVEIAYISKHSNTCLNFYNNPNKENYYKEFERLKDY